MKMKLHWVMSILVITTLVFLVTAAAASMMIPANDKAKAPDLEKIEFIHYKDGKVKVLGKAPKSPTCYNFITPTKIKWTTLPVNYAINPTNLDSRFVCSAVTTSAETWDGATRKGLFTDYTTCPIDSTAVYGVRDYINAITFGDYSTANVIAVTTVWYNPATKAIVEFDIMFDTDWTWGDADPNNNGKIDYPNLMDLQNIATHELGHGIGLGDVYDSVCSYVTMYGYSDYGEIQKRTLETPDVKGLQTLYGA